MPPIKSRSDVLSRLKPHHTQSAGIKGRKKKAAVEIKCRAQEELIWVVYNKAGHEKIKNIRKWFWVNSVSFPETHTDI